MRTKILLLVAAISAASLASSRAQVYSVNTVGYVNVTLVGNSQFTLVSNPLDNGTNSLTSLVGTAAPAKSVVQTWTGSSFATLTKGPVWDTTIIPVGTGFFVKNGIAGSPTVTNTFVGTVIPNSGNSVTTSIPVGTILVGSVMPVGGGINDVGVGTFNLIAGTANKTVLSLWDPVAQNYGGDNTQTKGAAGFAVNKTIAVGQGFFLRSIGPVTNWVQTLP